jgi:hypothetical protein
MKITSITTSHGAALFVEAIAPYSPILIPEGWGLVVSGDRRLAMTISCNCPEAKWIADYCHKSKRAVVIRAGEGAPHGSYVDFDPYPTGAVCPHCGNTEYNSKGKQWVCKSCNRTWLKGGAKPKGGRREGAGRKVGGITPIVPNSLDKTGRSHPALHLDS